MRTARSIKVLQVVRGLSNLSGLTHVVVPLSEELARLGLDVSVYFVEKDKSLVVKPNGTLIESQCFSQTFPPSSAGISVGFAKALSRDINRFDLVHIHSVWNFPTSYTMWIANKVKTPYIVAPHGSFEPWAIKQRYWRKRLYGNLIDTRLLNKATYLHALTSKEANQFRSYGAYRPSVIIPNGIHENNYNGTRPSLQKLLGLPPTHRTVLFLSRVHPKKGLDILLKGFQRYLVELNQRHVTLVVAGSDGGSGYLEEMKRLATELELDKHCKFIGEVSGQTKFDTYRGADAFALISHSEGLPIVVIEAMAAGCPVIVTTDCNLPEIADYNAGLVVQNCPEAVSKALHSVLTHPEWSKKMGINGRRLVQERFTWPRIAKLTVEFYRQAVTDECQVQ